MNETVDVMIKAELANLYLKLGIAKKKLKPIRPPRPRPIKKPKIPLENLIKGRHPKDLMGDITRAGVIKTLAPANISDFKGDENFLRTLVESKATNQPDPSLAQLRHVCSDFIILPLANGFRCGCEEDQIRPPPVLQDDQEVQVAKMKCDQANRTYLFYGPPGTGKSLMVRAIAHESRAFVLDISGYNTADRFRDKKQFQQMLVTVFRVAKAFQPSIILFDEVEQYFPGKAKKKPGKKVVGPVIGRCSKFKKDFMAQVAKHLAHTDRVAVIGLTNKPWLCDLKECTKFFSRKFYFPFPDNTARGLIFNTLVEKEGVKLTDAFQLSLFTHMTEGLTPGSMHQAIQAVLTKRRKADIKLRPLTVQDFIMPLSDAYSCSAEEYQMFMDFTYAVTGIKARHEEIERLLDPKAGKGKGAKR